MDLEIQERDIQIMKFVFACRVVTYDQIARRQFAKSHGSIARRRIRKLADQGYFKISMIELFKKGVRIVQPLPAVWPHINEKWPFVVDRPHFKSESPEHDVRMAEVFMRFEKLKCYRNFFTENLLQSSSALAVDPRFRDPAKLQSDGALTIQDTGGQLRVYAIELELSKKSMDAYRQKFVDYYLARGIDGVLYVSPEREIGQIITRVDHDISKERDSIMHFSLEKDVVCKTDKLIFSNKEERAIELS